MRDAGRKASRWAIVCSVAALFLGALAADQGHAAQRPPPPAAAVPRPSVDLDLVLAVDASGSVSDDRFALQMQGYANAFRSPTILQAIRAGNMRAIGVTMVQWTGPSLHVPVIPWMIIKDQASANAVAAAIAAAPRELFGGGTSISGAIDFSRALLEACPYAAPKHVIDISGDGSNNSGRDVEEARDEAVKAKVFINGLPIVTIEPDLDQYYRQFVIGGPGSFVIAVKSYDAFANGILRKLVAEISMEAPNRGAKLAAAR